MFGREQKKPMTRIIAENKGMNGLNASSGAKLISFFPCVNTCNPRSSVLRPNSGSLSGRRPAAVLSVADFLQPVDGLAIERLLDRDVSHRRGGRRAVPVFFTRRKPDHVARTNLLNRTALALRSTAACCHDQRLAEWMSMPRCPGSRFKGDTRANRPGRRDSLE